MPRVETPPTSNSTSPAASRCTCGGTRHVPAVGGSPTIRARAWLLAAAFSLACAAFCGCAAPTFERERLVQFARHSAPDREGVPADVRELFDRINRHRRAIGCPSLAWDPRLTAVGERHSEDMARRKFFSHVTPEGLDPFQRLSQAGVRYRAAAENLAMGIPSGVEVFQGWMHSPGHRRNLDDPAYTEIGIGRYGDYWSCEMARLAPEMARLTPESTP